MRCLEIVCLTTTATNRDAAIAAVAPFREEQGLVVRIYRHERHPSDVAVHVMHGRGMADHAEAVAARIAAALETHGLVHRARWQEVSA